MVACEVAPWWVRVREIVLQLWSVGALIWFSCMLRFWERKESVLRQRWGLEGRGFGQTRLPEFFDHKFITKSYNKELEMMEYWYPPWVQALKFLVALPVTLAFMSVVLAIGAACLALEIFLTYKKNEDTGTMGVDVGFFTFLVFAAPGIVFAILADAVCTELLKVVAKALTNWEAHEFRLGFERSMTYKLCAMFMCNVFVYFLAVGATSVCGCVGGGGDRVTPAPPSPKGAFMVENALTTEHTCMRTPCIYLQHHTCTCTSWPALLHCFEFSFRERETFITKLGEGRKR
jgi:hypothetical protein